MVQQCLLNKVCKHVFQRLKKDFSTCLIPILMRKGNGANFIISCMLIANSVQMKFYVYTRLFNYCEITVTLTLASLFPRFREIVISLSMKLIRAKL